MAPDEGEVSLLDAPPDGTTPAPEAGTPTPEPGTPAQGEGGEGAPSWLWDADVPGTGEQPDYLVTDKYKTVADQARAYVEANKALAGFTGAPVDADGAAAPYELAVPEDLQGGLELDADSPMIEQFEEIARGFNMNKECAQAIFDIYCHDQYQSHLGFWESEMEKLGTNHAEVRKSLSEWGQANLDKEQMAVFREGCNSASAIRMAKLMVDMMKPEPKIDAKPTQTAAEGAVDELTRLRAKVNDQYMQDPIYRAEVDAELEDYHRKHPEIGR